MAGVLKTKFDALEKEVQEIRGRIAAKEQEISDEKKKRQQQEQELERLQSAIDAKSNVIEDSREKLEESRKMKRTISVCGNDDYYAQRSLEMTGTDLQKRLRIKEADLRKAEQEITKLDRSMGELQTSIEQTEGLLDDAERRLKVAALQQIILERKTYQVTTTTTEKQVRELEVQVDKKTEEIEAVKDLITKAEADIYELQNF